MKLMLGSNILLEFLKFCIIPLYEHSSPNDIKIHSKEGIDSRLAAHPTTIHKIMNHIIYKREIQKPQLPKIRLNITL